MKCVVLINQSEGSHCAALKIKLPRLTLRLIRLFGKSAKRRLLLSTCDNFFWTCLNDLSLKLITSKVFFWRHGFYLLSSVFWNWQPLRRQEHVEALRIISSISKSIHFNYVIDVDIFGTENPTFNIKRNLLT